MTFRRFRQRSFAPVSAALLLGLALPAAAFAQAGPGNCPSAPVADHGKSVDGKPLASPPAEAEVKLDGKSIVIHYNQPSVRCRKIMGGLVPYGKVWRTGANPATSFVTDTDLMVGSLKVPAGKYTLYTLPAAPGTPWQLIINKQTGQWGTVYNEGQDLGRTPMHGASLPAMQETMTIGFEKTHGGATQLHVKWDKTDEWVEVKLAK